VTLDRLLTADVIVVGSGVAGLSAALAAAPARVVMATKGPAVSGSTPWAQGGIAAPIGTDDSPARHAADTLAVGGGRNDPSAVAVLTAEAGAAIESLVASGARFDRDDGGAPALAREAGHSLHRVLHAHGDATGAEIARALVEAIRRSAHATIMDHAFAADLVVAGGRIAGVTFRTAEGERLLVAARAVVLATGGIGRVYANTTNPPEVTGDGLAMAHRAGARLADLEFVQFHPTALAGGGDPMPLLTEALRGEGAVLLDGSGHRFLKEEHPDAELAPRDIVARAIWRRVVAGDRVVLDAREAVGAAFPERFPTVFAACAERGIDPRSTPIPVAPAAHYHMGGIATDLHGRCSVPGLWAVGEAARTGVHGANRLASNSLLEGAVFGARAGVSAATEGLPAPTPAELGEASDPGEKPDSQLDAVALLRDVMWTGVGVVRTGAGLRSALDELERLDDKIHPAASEARSMVETARLVAAAALARPASCGAHHRDDGP
jgi:L-aspartate oxidase